MNKEQLEAQLHALRQKWFGHVPKNDMDPDWWAFKCDSVIATRIKHQLASSENLQTVAEQIFGSK
ncbi:hypothetical protein KJ836_02800 [Patescibacteria group bacterium]|nr:hypothetical protein [Patescibacteria group bacterium]